MCVCVCVCVCVDIFCVCCMGSCPIFYLLNIMMRSSPAFFEKKLRLRLGTLAVSWRTHVKIIGRRSRGCCATSRGRLINRSSSPSVTAKVG